jgi:hypothetical protein
MKTGKEEIDQLLKMGYSKKQIDSISKFEKDFEYMQVRLLKTVVNDLLYDKNNNGILSDPLTLYSALSYWLAAFEIIIKKHSKHSKDDIDAILQSCISAAELYYSKLLEGYEKERQHIDIDDKRSLK